MFKLPNLKETKLQKPWLPDDNVSEIINNEEINSISKIKNLEKQITFRLYTKETGKKYQLLKINDIEGLKNSHFDPRRPTRFLSHGWRTAISRSSSLRKKIRKGKYLTYFFGT